jgi:tripartite-type tricarboxylate transporter receptor subunit TctC
MRDHLPLARDQLQRLGHILADLAQSLVATAWADRNVITKLNAAAKGAMAEPTVRARLADLGVDIPPPDQQTPEALGALQKSEIEKWWPIIKAANILGE